MQTIMVGDQAYEFPDEMVDDEIAQVIRAEMNRQASEAMPSFEIDTGLTPEDANVFVEAAEYAGMTHDDMARIARAESQFDMEANKGTKKAQGLFQFFPMAWTDAKDQLERDGKMELTQADKYNANSAWAAAAYQRRYRSLLSDNPTLEERYALHLLGPTQFRKVMESEGGVGEYLSPAAIRGNPSLFPNKEDTTREELMEVISKKMEQGEA